METPAQLDASTQNHLAAAEGLGHVEALAANPHFAWFVKEVLEAARDEEGRNAVNLQRTGKQRTAACHRLALASDLCGALEKKRALWQKQISQPR